MTEPTRPSIVHTGGTHDRAGLLRTQAAWRTAQLRDPDARALLVGPPVTGPARAAASQIPLVGGTRGPRLHLARLAELPSAREDALILVGLRDDAPLYAVPVPETGPLPPGRWWSSPQRVSALLPDGEASLVAHALALVEFARTHRFCGACGKPMEARHGGVQRSCTPCKRTVWGRSDPVALVLVHDGDRVLLGRERGWPKERFELLAGFVEPGESVEEAAVREIHEEAGIRIGALEWFGSQPWPYPHELILGFFARWLEGEARPTDDELAEVRWFDRREVAAALRRDRRAFVPPEYDTLAHAMLEAWVSGG